MPNRDSAEQELLRTIARPQCDRAAIAALTARVDDFEKLVALAREHGVVPLLYARLSESGSSLPAESMRQMDEEYCANAVQSLAAVSELVALLDDFAQREIRALPFKGVALANEVYGKIGLRPPGDLDVLVGRKDAREAARIAIKRGYELSTPLRADGSPAPANVFEYHLERPSDGMVLELRWRLTQWYLHADVGLGWAWPHRKASTLQGATISVMSPEDTLMLLCLHGSKHGWSRLIWICDVAWLLARYPEFDWSRVMRDTRKFGLAKHVELGVALAHTMLGAALPDSPPLELSPPITKLAHHLDERFFDTNERMAAGPVPFHLQLLGTRDRLRWAWRQQPWTPNEMDRAVVRLPAALGFIYYLIRPLRVVHDSWKRRRI